MGKSQLPQPGELRGNYTVHVCKRCGKEFRRRPWGHSSREYCTPNCEPITQTGRVRKTTVADLVIAALTAPEAEKQEYLLLIADALDIDIADVLDLDTSGIEKERKTDE